MAVKIELIVYFKLFFIDVEIISLYFIQIN